MNKNTCILVNKSSDGDNNNYTMYAQTYTRYRPDWLTD